MALYGGYEGGNARTMDDQYGPRGAGAQGRGANVPRPPAPRAPVTSVTKQPTSSYTPAWTATLPEAQQAPAGTPQPYLGTTTPVNSVVGLSPEERQRIYNQARGNFLGTSGAAASSMANQLGGRGFVPGESGIADSAIGKVWSEGLKGYGDAMTGIATSEMKDRFNQGFALDQLKSQQGQWAQEFGAGRMDKSTEELLAYLNLMQGSQATQYAPYWNSLSGANLSEANYGGK